jgi:hypothetical protein
MHIEALYYGEDGALYNKSKSAVKIPDNAKILLLGPHTGAQETSVSLEGNTVTVQGTTPRGLAMAGDKLSLIAMGVTEENIKSPGLKNQ